MFTALLKYRSISVTFLKLVALIPESQVKSWACWEQLACAVHRVYAQTCCFVLWIVNLKRKPLSCSFDLLCIFKISRLLFIGLVYSFFFCWHQIVTVLTGTPLLLGLGVSCAYTWTRSKLSIHVTSLPFRNPTRPYFWVIYTGYIW